MQTDLWDCVRAAHSSTQQGQAHSWRVRYSGLQAAAQPLADLASLLWDPLAPGQ